MCHGTPLLCLCTEQICGPFFLEESVLWERIWSTRNNASFSKYRLRCKTLLNFAVDIGEVKTVGMYSRKKSALDYSSVYISHTKCSWVDDSSRNSVLSWWVIYWLWHNSYKQKAPFPQGVSTVDHHNSANHSQYVTKVQEVKTCDSHLATVMSPGNFTINCLFTYD